MASPSSPPHTSLHSIPLAFGLALTPHLYGLTRLMIATRNTMSIAMPRTKLEHFKTTLPKDLWNHLARARGAHLNSLEVFPLYAAAILAGNMARTGAYAWSIGIPMLALWRAGNKIAEQI
ncbi:Putative membrane-associated, eicosanoid/glutathione metabolism (MAPEG) protein [Septoria linicola]|uniref:Membrane-associated, eicosanoid/glutathione metabolism (MAPEG) protein n=1 Tax=Septoria linicola TaxID=215465 RepID=A0A9Q9B175_9PEZI|nr:Putative membrane-associated, eicosanoid/glutathione metabolism (MAPEG) protein [Septoria linicola]